MSPALQIVLFIAVLAFLKFALGVPVSILGSLILTLILSAIAYAVNTSRRV